MLPTTYRSVVAILTVVLLAIVVWFTTTSGGLFLGIFIVALIAAGLYYGGYNMDRILKGGY